MACEVAGGLAGCAPADRHSSAPRRLTILREQLGVQAWSTGRPRQDLEAVFGFALGFLSSSSKNSKKMLAPLKTRNMFG
jgi:hypothetical protein